MICLGKFNDGRPAEALVTCGHVYHVECIVDYMSATGKSKEDCCAYAYCRARASSRAAVDLEVEDTAAAPNSEGSGAQDASLAGAVADAEASAAGMN